MPGQKVLGNGWRALREMVWPTYRPECHYMRGPGPACARKCGRN